MRLHAGAYAGGTCTPHLEKMFRSVMSKRGEKFRPDISANKNVHVPLRYDKIKTNKVGKKEEKRDKIKETKKEDGRLSEIEILK